MFVRRLFLAVPIAFAGMAAMVQADVMRFDEPKVDGVLLDYCRVGGSKCGQPATDAFCRANGYRRTVRYVKAENVGQPTLNIADKTICDGAECDSFVWIECAK
jgi:hypothetical protein